MLFRTFNCFLITRCIRFLRFQRKNKQLVTDISKKLTTVNEVLIGAQICCASVTKQSIKMDIEEIEKAIHEGDIAIIKLMDIVKDFVQVISKEYRNCLRKQMEITEKAQKEGHYSEMWDELPEYRCLADELHQQLNDYDALFQTLGKMAEIQLSDRTNQDNSLTVNVNEKFKESQEIIKQEFEENRKLQMELLKLNCDTILMEMVTSGSEN